MVSLAFYLVVWQKGRVMKIKKALAALLALVIVFVLAQPAFAIDGEPIAVNAVESFDNDVDTEKPTYSDYLRFRLEEGFELIGEMGFTLAVAPITILFAWIPMIGFTSLLTTLISPFMFAVGLGEVMFSPIIAAFDVALQTDINY